MPDPTQPIPPSPSPQGQPPSGAGQAAGASSSVPGGAPAGHPGWPAGPPAGPAGPGGPPAGPPAGPGGVYAPGPPPKGPGLWRQATSTTGGRIAAVVALVLTGVLLLAVMAVGVFAVARFVDRGDRFGPAAERREEMRELGPGMPRRGDADRPGNRQGQGQGQGNGLGNKLDRLPGMGLPGAMGRVQHGEYTVTGTDGKPVTLLVQRGAVTSASATSVAVRSDDGFAATYAVNGSTRLTVGSAADLEAGDEVLVTARKDGRVALQVVRLG